jgi:hypothetical protein
MRTGACGSRGKSRCLIDKNVVRAQSEANHVPRLQDRFGDPAAIDKSAVWRVAIHQPCLAVNYFDLRMLSGDFWVGDHELILTGRAADVQAAGLNRKRLSSQGPT